MIFLDNKYTQWYWNIIKKAEEGLLEGKYFEKHHKIPKCFGGSNKKENLVRLPMRAHFICHWLLTKMVLDPKMLSQMNYALMSMQRSKKARSCLTGRQIERARIAHFEAMRISKRKLTDDEVLEKTRKYKETMIERYGVDNISKLPEISYRKSNIMKSRSFSDTHRERIRLSKIGKSPKAMSIPGAREKITASKIGRVRVHNPEILISRFVYKEDLDMLYSAGWKKGALPRSIDMIG